MKKKTNHPLRTQKIVSVITILFGAILLTYMVVVESEPGAIPLLIIIMGAVWFIISQYRSKK